VRAYSREGGVGLPAEALSLGDVPPGDGEPDGEPDLDGDGEPEPDGDPEGEPDCGDGEPDCGLGEDDAGGGLPVPAAGGGGLCGGWL
jgi:hypothetical protein